MNDIRDIRHEAKALRDPWPDAANCGSRADGVERVPVGHDRASEGEAGMLDLIGRIALIALLPMATFYVVLVVTVTYAGGRLEGVVVGVIVAAVSAIVALMACLVGLW